VKAAPDAAQRNNHAGAGLTVRRQMTIYRYSSGARIAGVHIGALAWANEHCGANRATAMASCCRRGMLPRHCGKETMNILMWLILGLLAGMAASRHFHHGGSAMALDVALAAGGAIGGGLAMSSLGFAQPSVLLIAGLLGAAAGSIAIIAAYRAIFRAA